MDIRYFEKRGKVWIDFKGPDGKRHRKPTGATTEAQAKQAAVAIVASIFSINPTSGLVTPSKSSRVAATMSLRDAFKLACKTRESWITCKDMEGKENDFAGLTTSSPKLTEDMDCSVMTKTLMTEMRDLWRTQKGLRKNTTLSHSTINHRLTMANILLEVAGCDPHNVKHLSVKNNRRKRRVREEELQAMISWMLSNHQRKGATSMADLIQVALHTTARINDLLTVRWADVYLDHRQIVFRDPKNGEVHNGVIDDVALRILERRATYGLDGPFTDLGYPQANSLWNLGKAAIGLADDPEFVFHVATRHEGLSRLGEAGASPFQMKAYSGHKTIAAMDRYVKPSTDSLVDLGKYITRSQDNSTGGKDAELH